MKSIFHKSKTKSTLLTAILIFSIGLIGLTGCKNKETANTGSSADDLTAVTENSDLSASPTAIITPVPELTKTPVGNDNSSENNFIQSAALIGLSKDELITKLGDEYNKVDEGGLEFIKQEIRVWFDDNGKVNQVYTNSPNIDFNGAKVGDDISKFTAVFSNPTSDSNGHSIYPYDKYYLSVFYDTATQKIFAVYILSEELGTEVQGEGTEAFFGDWVINQVMAYGSVGTYSKESAEGLIGKSMSFSSGSATCFGDDAALIDQTISNPSYEKSEISSSDFITEYRMTFEKLGISSDSVTIVNATDAEGNGCTFLVKDDNTLIVIGGGTYFELVRQ